MGNDIGSGPARSISVLPFLYFNLNQKPIELNNVGRILS